MAAIAKSGTPSISTARPSAEHQFAGLLAGEAVEAGDACTIRDDGYVYRAGSGDTYRGIAAGGASVSESVTLYHGVSFHYARGLTPGSEVRLGSDGALDDADGDAVGFAVDGSRIFFYALAAPVSGGGA